MKKPSMQIGLGIALGAGIGTAISIALGSGGAWLALGIAIGVTIGIAMSRTKAGSHSTPSLPSVAQGRLAQLEAVRNDKRFW